MGEILEGNASRYGEKAALILGDSKITYKELDETSNRIANALIKMGLKKGDRVAISLNNSPEFVAIYFGIIKSGGAAALLDSRYKIDELSSVLGNCTPIALFTESPTLEYIAPALGKFPYIKSVVSLNPAHKGQFLTYDEIKSNNSAEKPPVRASIDDITTITYSSAPSTRPLGAMFSHRNMVNEATISAKGLEQTDKDVMMLYALPLHHMFGLASTLLGSILKACTIVIVPGTGISINTLMESIEKHKGTILLGVPYIFALAIKMAKREGIKSDLSSLRFCGSGGAPLPIDTVLKFKRYYGFYLGDLYGLTEAVSHVTCQPVDGSGKLGSCGRVLPGWQVKIVDDDDNELPLNQSGEIVIKGLFMRGYYNNPQATTEIIRNGWLHSGDIGKMDEDGYVYITGRKKRMIILKGQNVYPDDIETVLITHPKIARARVVGVPDKLRGETVKATIYLKEGEVCTEQEIRQFCQEHMADYKAPRRIVFKQTRTRKSKSGT